MEGVKFRGSNCDVSLLELRHDLFCLHKVLQILKAPENLPWVRVFNPIAPLLFGLHPISVEDLRVVHPAHQLVDCLP